MYICIGYECIYVYVYMQIYILICMCIAIVPSTWQQGGDALVALSERFIMVKTMVVPQTAEWAPDGKLSS